MGKEEEYKNAHVRPTAVEEKRAASHICGLCGKGTSDPRLLSCLHSFCSKCLVKLDLVVVAVVPNGNISFGMESPGKNKQIVLCPTCESQTELQKQGVSALPINYVLISQDAKNRNAQQCTSSAVCDLCTGDNCAMFHCTECCVRLCTLCKEAHSRQKQTASHVVMSVNDENLKHVTNALVPQPSLALICEKHPGKEMIIFCETCDRPGCPDCCVTEHGDHKCSLIVDVSDKQTKVVENLLRQTKPHIRAIEKVHSRVAKTRESLDLKSTSLVNEVNYFVDSQISALEKHRGNLISQVSSLREEKEGKLRMQQIELEQLREGFRHSCRVTEEVLAEGSPVEVLCLKRPLVRRLRELNRHKYKLEPNENDNIRCDPYYKNLLFINNPKLSNSYQFNRMYVNKNVGDL